MAKNLLHMENNYFAVKWVRKCDRYWCSAMWNVDFGEDRKGCGRYGEE